MILPWWLTAKDCKLPTTIEGVIFATIMLSITGAVDLSWLKCERNLSQDCDGFLVKGNGVAAGL
jgi:hypothetical protein